MVTKDKTTEQKCFELDAESLTSREKKLVQRLQEYRTIERDIREQEKIISGELTRCMPSMSPAGVPEDDEAVLAALEIQDMSERFQYIVQTVGKSVDMSHARYTDRQRVAKRLSRISVDDADEDQALQDAYMILTERENEPYLKLTQAERYASDREKEVAEAEERLNVLVHRRNSIKHALEDMQKYEPEWYLILWHRYVLVQPWKQVCRIASRNGVELTKDEYILARRKALRQFDKWAVGLN